MTKISETETMRVFLNDHELISWGLGIFTHPTGFISDINKAFRDHIPFVSGIEDKVYIIGAGVISSVYTIYSYTVESPVRVVYSYVKSPIKGVKTGFDHLKSPFSYLGTYFSNDKY
jgi:hypothetical protein